MRRPECLVIRSTNHFNWLLSTQRSCSSTLCCIFPDIQTLLAATYSLWSYEGGKVDQLSSLQQPSKVSASLQTPHQFDSVLFHSPLTREQHPKILKNSPTWDSNSSLLPRVGTPPMSSCEPWPQIWRC